MSNRKLYALAALFSTPNDIGAAANAIKNEYKQFDVNTPYPVHGMDGAMGLPETKIGYVPLIFGFLGLVSAVWLQWWTSAIDYPLIIGGKPLFSFPAFVPIIFELTVLFAAVGGVSLMLAWFFKFPFNAHPLHDSPYMAKVSSDHFGIYVEASDPNFDAAKLRATYESLNAVAIEEIYFDAEEQAFRNPFFDKKLIGVSVALFIGVAIITDLHLVIGLESPPLNWMKDQPRFDPLEESDFYGTTSTMALPVDGTVARGLLPYPYADDPEGAGKYLENPLMPTAEVLARGKQQYDIFCGMCHGDYGSGDGRLNDKFPIPPSLHSSKVRDTWTDGRIFHVLTMGQNSMPAYDKQIPRDDRWAIVHHLRVLQRAMNAKEADLK
jgi:mono/diheme cytochrome c family protein